MRNNYELRADARQMLSGKWGMPILVCFLYNVILSFSGSVPFAVIIIGGPMELGLVRYFLLSKRGENPELENMFDGFKLFSKSLVLGLLTGIFTFLWSLLFVVPGIIAALSYSQAFYILNDNPGIEAMEAIRQSKEMMKGYKGRLFCLYLSFIGWFFLCILTLGIGFLWLTPYIKMTSANFYEELRQAHQQASGF